VRSCAGARDRDDRLWFFGPDALPEPMHPGQAERVPVCFDLLRTGRTHHDPATSLGIDLPMHHRPS